MAKKTWKLVDASENLNVDGWKIAAVDVAGGPNGLQIQKKTLRSGLSAGVDVIEVNNGSFQFSILPTRGMGIWKGWMGDFPVGWQSPVRGPVNPAHVPLMEPSGLGWLDGFDELLCRCGLLSNGAPDFDEQGKLAFPLHGRIANKPAHHVEVEVDGDEICIKGVVEESRFHFTKLRLTTTIKTKFHEPGFRIHDEVENFSASDGEMQMLYHVNFGTPLLESGAEVVLPVDTIVPRNDWAAAGIGHWSTYSEPKAGMEERVYFFKLLGDNKGNSMALLKNSKSNRGVSLDFNVNQLPCFSVWKNETAIADGYVTGLEPGTNFPNPRTYEAKQNRVVQLKPGSMHVMDISLSLHGSADQVSEVEKEIASLQKTKSPTVHNKPQTGWCAP